MKKSSRAQKKLETDLLNFIFRPMALMFNPSLAVIMFSFALYFSWQHNKVHLKKNSQMKDNESKEQKKYRENKRNIIEWRMRLDAVGLLASIIVLVLQLTLASTGLQSFYDGLLFVAALSIVASSGMSTANKIYRFRKEHYKPTIADGFRAFFGLVGTAILAGLLFHFIPQAWIMHPLVIVGTVLVMGGLAIHKTYRVYQEQQEHAKRLDKVDNAENTLMELASMGQMRILKILKKDGDYDFDEILDNRLIQILSLIKPSTPEAELKTVRIFLKNLHIKRVDLAILIDSQVRLKKENASLYEGLRYIYVEGSDPRTQPSPAPQTVIELTPMKGAAAVQHTALILAQTPPRKKPVSDAQPQPQPQLQPQPANRPISAS
jgi:hypothetical protein